MPDRPTNNNDTIIEFMGRTEQAISNIQDMLQRLLDGQAVYCHEHDMRLDACEKRLDSLDNCALDARVASCEKSHKALWAVVTLVGSIIVAAILNSLFGHNNDVAHIGRIICYLGFQLSNTLTLS